MPKKGSIGIFRKKEELGTNEPPEGDDIDPYVGPGSYDGKYGARPKSALGQDTYAEQRRKAEDAKAKEDMRQHYSKGYGPSICVLPTIIGVIITCLVFLANYL